MGPQAALVYRVKLNVDFGSVKAHGTENFFSSGSYYHITATTEDELFLKWANSFSITGAIYAKYSKYLQSQIKYNPIPGSYRDMNPHEFDAKGAKKSKFTAVNNVKSFLHKYKIW